MFSYFTFEKGRTKNINLTTVLSKQITTARQQLEQQQRQLGVNHFPSLEGKEVCGIFI